MIPHAGEAAALATAFCWTFTSLAFESAGRRVGSLAVNFLRLVPAFFLLLFFCWAWRGKPFPWD
ncbi:MAG TPA: EamA family transporter, partial [Planctomycetes bacterium]|nr:EamA family transporter [Planctomycetota bacterium]